MTHTHKSALLDHFLNETVYVTTDLMSAVQLETGEMVEAPLILEGILLDYDASYFLVGQDNRDNLEIIRRDRVVGIKQISETDEVMEDVSKPERSGMN
jgi:hypothetical protein